MKRHRHTRYARERLYVWPRPLGERVASSFAIPLRTALSRFASASNRPERSEGTRGKLREGAQSKLSEPVRGYG
jgi:hypothetical protein